LLRAWRNEPVSAALSLVSVTVKIEGSQRSSKASTLGRTVGRGLLWMGLVGANSRRSQRERCRWRFMTDLVGE
jgi:hypothetical protein